MYVTTTIIDGMLEALNLEYAKSNPWLLKIIDEVVETARNRIAVAEMSKSLREIEKTTKILKLQISLFLANSMIKRNMVVVSCLL